VAREEVEERAVEKSELSSGVKLKAGHSVHLLVGGLKGAGTGSGGGQGTGGGGTAGGTGEAPGEGGGSDDGDPTSAGGGDDHGGGGSAPAKPASGGGTPATPSEAASGAAGVEASQGYGTGGADSDEASSPGDAAAPEVPPKTTPSRKAVFEAAHFETDKAFPLPSALQSFRDVAALANAEPSRSLLVLGHTDAVGTTEHNLGLSQDRADNVAAYLKNDVDAWVTCFDGESKSKQWGTREVQHMLHALPWGGDVSLKRAPAR
jgi:outer membrane protein OmpA-like peptidoglycan-associated protein